MSWESWGNGEVVDFSTVPLPVVELTDAVGVTAGYNQSCSVRANGGVSCWGSNARGSLGAGGDSPYFPHPVTVWPADR